MADVIPPWTLKGIPPEVRNGATAAAGRSKMGIAQWVARAILTQIQLDNQETSAVALVSEPVIKPVMGPERTAQISEVIALAKQLAEATGEPSPGVTRVLRGLVMDQARAMRGPVDGVSTPSRAGKGPLE